MMSHIVESCPLTKLNGSLSRLYSADEDAVSWLTSYGSWHAYEKKIDWSAVSSWLLHAELAADADNCRCKRRQSSHSIYAHRSSPLLLPWRKEHLKSSLSCTSNSVTAAQNIGPVHTRHRCTGQIPHPPTVTWSAACITHGFATSNWDAAISQ